MKKTLLLALCGLLFLSTGTLCAEKSTGGKLDLSQTVESPQMGGAQHFAVYFPPSYEAEPERNFPILYLLHGMMADYTSWAELGNLKTIADSVFAAGEVPEMVIVTPDGRDAFYCNVNREGLPYEDYFLEDFLPEVERRFRVDTSCGRAIAGLSMGGYGAAFMAFKHPELFSSSYAMSGGFVFDWGVPDFVEFVEAEVARLKAEAGETPLTEAELSEKLAKKFPPFVMECGTEDQLVFPMNEEVHTWLETAGFVHTYITREGVHDWDFWQVCLPKALHFAGENFKK